MNQRRRLDIAAVTRFELTAVAFQVNGVESPLSGLNCQDGAGVTGDTSSKQAI